MPTKPRAVLIWPLYAVVSVLCAVGGAVELVSRPHGATLVAGVIFLVLAASNAAQAVIAYRRRQAGHGAYGVPLPAVTAAQAVSQLVHRVIGPAGRDLAPVLDWAAGGDPAEITTRYGLPPTALQRRLRILRVVGAQIPLRPSVLAELSAPGATSEQHRRARRLFALRTPRGYLQMQIARSTDVALRVLATLGPQSVETLVEAANRSRQPTAKLPPVVVADLELGLRHRGATHDPITGRWTAPAGATPAGRDVQLVDALRAVGPLTRVQVRKVLIAVGYTSHSPQTTIVDRHPLIRRAAPNRYELITEHRSQST